MAKNNNFLITRPEVKFWLAIIAMAVAYTVTFVSLQNKVDAMYEKGVTLRSDYEDTASLLIEVRDSQIRMEKDVGFIKDELFGE